MGELYCLVEHCLSRARLVTKHFGVCFKVGIGLTRKPIRPIRCIPLLTGWQLSYTDVSCPYSRNHIGRPRRWLKLGRNWTDGRPAAYMSVLGADIFACLISDCTRSYSTNIGADHDYAKRHGINASHIHWCDVILESGSGFESDSSPYSLGLWLGLTWLDSTIHITDHLLINYRPFLDRIQADVIIIANAKYIQT